MFNWEIDPSATETTESGRRLLLVTIGVQQIVDTDTGDVIDTAPVAEYIYEDILAAIFNREEYTSRICLGCTPPLIVTYENRLVMHNNQISEEVEKILGVLKTAQRDNVYEVLVNSQLNYDTRAQISKEYREVKIGRAHV